MARIVRFHQTGGPEVLKLENVDPGAPGEGEMLIDVRAIGLNRAEAMFRSGMYLDQPTFPAKLGYEAAGIVASVGHGVREFKPGDVISTVPGFTMTKYGVYGDQAIVPAAMTVKHPATLSYVEAASIWMQYLTAYGALIDIAQLSKGDAVIIPAASSSVGIAAIQIANSVGALSIATTRTAAKREALLNLGAQHVVVTDEQELVSEVHAVTDGKGARVIFDPVAGKGIETLAAAAATGGIIFIYGALSATSTYGQLSLDPTPFPLMTALGKGLNLRGYTLIEIVGNAERFAKGKNFILEGLDSGAFTPVIAKTFPLDQIVEAHRYLESNQQIGKIVVTV